MPDHPVLLFDVMDTLVYDPFNEETPAFFGMTQTELLEQNNRDAWIQVELGQISEHEYLTRYFRDLRPFDHAAFRRNLAHAYRWIDGIEGILAELNSRGYALHAFSNYPVWYRTIEEKLGLSKYLQWTFVSCLTGHRKPSRTSFEFVARTLHRSFDSLLFIDNSEENCNSAKVCGIPTIEFFDTTQLRAELRVRGLLQ